MAGVPAVASEPLTLARLNGLSMLGFVNALFPLYDRGSWVLPLVYAQRPFLSLDHLHRALTEIVASADPAAKQAILAEQPDFLTRTGAAPGPEREAAEGLDEAARRSLRKTQADYQKKFGFPLVVSFAAARAAGEDVAAASAARLANPLDRELADATDELARIARYKLGELVAG
jgi:2-oxo-4-hydroxy-4-carboxy-5-ureidoimidazoline decarboxylase